MITYSALKNHPLVHCITNYVAANDTANLLLSINASPIMADNPNESADITASSDALLVNLGTPNEEKFKAITLSVKAANEKGIPVVLDPVGVAASAWRLKFAKELLLSKRICVIRANAAEAKAILNESTAGGGVDSFGDVNSEAVALKLARKYSCVAAITGKTDVITDGERIIRVKNGNDTLKKVTGSGCMTSALITAFCSEQDPFDAAVIGTAFMGICGEIADASKGTASFRISLLDAASVMDETTFNRFLRTE